MATKMLTWMIVFAVALGYGAIVVIGKGFPSIGGILLGSAGTQLLFYVFLKVLLRKK